MRTLQIGTAFLPVKDYHCADASGEYIPKDRLKLWLYINLTNRCNARRPFCVNPAVERETHTVSPALLRRTLTTIKDHICGVSITGGEPMLYPHLVDKTAELVTALLGPELPLELVTNGTFLKETAALGSFDRFSGIHISRHCTENADNAALMRAETPTWSRLCEFLTEVPDPGKITLNCVLQTGGVENPDDARAYLERAAWAGIKNVSFVGMFPANPYCREHYISPKALALAEDDRFSIWTEQHDYDFCSCSGGDYRSKYGYIRFYYRCPGTGSPAWVRQLVYHHDDRLLAGFGGKDIPL